MVHLILVLYLMFGLTALGPERSKTTKLPVALHLETVISDSDDAILGRFGGATITHKGEVLYTDAGRKTVLVFNTDGEYTSKFGREGRGPGEFLTPSSISTDAEGYIYIADNRNARISVWSTEFEYFTDIELTPGWNIHFKKNERALYVFNKPFRRMPSGNDAIVISKINRNDRKLEQLFKYEIIDWFDEERPFSTFSKWVITSNDRIISTGAIDDHRLRRISLQGNIEAEFGVHWEPIYYNEDEMNTRIEVANSINPDFAAMIADGRNYKHIYSNIEICDQNWLWVHRNKKFGARDELDIYTAEGEYKTMVTIPASENELRMLGIYGEKILFHITTPEGEEKLHVFRIEYSES